MKSLQEWRNELNELTATPVTGTTPAQPGGFANFQKALAARQMGREERQLPKAAAELRFDLTQAIDNLAMSDPARLKSFVRRMNQIITSELGNDYRLTAVTTAINQLAHAAERRRTAMPGANGAGTDGAMAGGSMFPGR